MKCPSVPAIAIGMLLSATAVPAQVQPPPAPWRGAGPTPCVGTDGGVYKCPPAPHVIAVRAGRLFDSKAGQMLTRQVVVLHGERITDVGPEAPPVTIPKKGDTPVAPGFPTILEEDPAAIAPLATSLANAS